MHVRFASYCSVVLRYWVRDDPWHCPCGGSLVVEYWLGREAWIVPSALVPQASASFQSILESGRGSLILVILPLK